MRVIRSSLVTTTSHLVDSSATTLLSYVATFFLALFDYLVHDVLSASMFDASSVFVPISESKWGLC